MNISTHAFVASVGVFLLALVGLVWSVHAMPCDFTPQALSIASASRALPIKAPVKCRSVSKKMFQEIALELLKKDIHLRRLQSEEKAFHMLGLIPADYPYARCFLQSYIMNGAAFYNAHKKEFIVPNWYQTPSWILVHEAVHALQDQHFDLKVLGNIPTILSDEALARGALIEGDATVVEDRYASRLAAQEQDLDESNQIRLADKRCNLPKTISSLLDFQYNSGATYILSLREGSSWDRVNNAFLHPPENTTQIMHRKEFEAKSISPLVPSAPMFPAFLEQGDNRKVLEDTLGEYAVATLLSTGVSRREGFAAADGWAGDRFALYHRKNPSQKDVLTWVTHWRSEGEQQEFFETLQKFLIARYPDLAFVNDLSTPVTFSTLETLRVSKKGMAVLLEVSTSILGKEKSS